MASSGIWRMCTASEATAAICMDASGEINNMVAGFREDTGSKNTDITIFAIEVEVAGAVITETLRIVLPTFKRKVNSGGQMFFMVVFRGA